MAMIQHKRLTDSFSTNETSIRSLNLPFRASYKLRSDFDMYANQGVAQRILRRGWVNLPTRD